MKRTAAMFLALGLLVAGTAPVRADAVYHTERLTLNAVGGAAGTGMVVNVHPNGPNRYAIENYQLRHADPGATYQVWLNLYLGAANCNGAPAVPIATAQILTNGAGNGTAQLVLAPENIAAANLVSGMSFPINWTVTQEDSFTHEDIKTHETNCTVVELD